MRDKQKVLVYLASGPYRAEYEKLPFDKIILIDYHAFRNDQLGEKVECWSCNVLDAVERLKRRNLKISCLVNINEGLQEGGGSFVMLSHFMMGYLSPCLLDEFVLVSDLNYYKSVHILGKIKKLDWGFDFTKLTRSDEDFLNPCLFTHKAYRNGVYKEVDSFGEVFRLKRIQKSKSLALNLGVHVQVKQKSIWQDTDELDLIGVSISSQSEIFRHRSPNIRSYFLEKQKTLDIQGLSMIEILDYCEKNEIQSLGLMPWMDGNYSGAIEAIKRYSFTFLKKIAFYHLSKKDYAQLYNYPNEINQNKTHE